MSSSESDDSSLFSKSSGDDASEASSPRPSPATMGRLRKNAPVLMNKADDTLRLGLTSKAQTRESLKLTDPEAKIDQEELERRAMHLLMKLKSNQARKAPRLMAPASPVARENLLVERKTPVLTANEENLLQLQDALSRPSSTAEVEREKIARSRTSRLPTPSDSMTKARIEAKVRQLQAEREKHRKEAQEYVETLKRSVEGKIEQDGDLTRREVRNEANRLDASILKNGAGIDDANGRLSNIESLLRAMSAKKGTSRRSIIFRDDTESVQSALTTTATNFCLAHIVVK